MAVIIVAGAVVFWMWPRPHAKKRRLVLPVICIDPGHPTAFNAGRRRVNGATELAMNWDVALKLEALLQQTGRVRVVMTREQRDLLMNNPERAQVANDCGARLFLRLHCDAGPNHGYTLYYPNRQGTDDGLTGPSAEVIEASRRAAWLMHSGMAPLLRGLVHDRGIKGENFTKVGKSQGALTGSIFSKVPVVTVEMVFLTNRWDARFIESEAGQDQMARALANGVMLYLSRL